MPEFVQSLRVLEKLGYVRNDKSLTLKGAALCELGTPSSVGIERADNHGCWPTDELDRRAAAP